MPGGLQGRSGGAKSAGPGAPPTPRAVRARPSSVRAQASSAAGAGPPLGAGQAASGALRAGGPGPSGAAVAREVALFHGLELGPKNRESEDVHVDIRSFSFQDSSPCQR